MIDKLNFAKTDVGAIGDRGLSSFADTLLKQGNVFNAQAAQDQEQALNTVKTMSDIASRDRAEQREVDRINKENSTQEALVNYNNAVNRASTLGTMSDEQGKSLGSEYGSLVSKVGEEKAAQIISDKAANYAATDAANLKASPKLAYDRISPIELPSGSSIDPLKLIEMKEQKLSALEDRQNKLDDQAFKEKEFEADKKYKADSLAEQIRTRKAAEARLNQEDKEKKDAVSSAAIAAKFDATGVGGDGYTVNGKGEYVKNVGTGVNSLNDVTDGQTLESAGSEFSNRFDTENKDLISKRKEIEGKAYTPEQLKDKDFMQKEYFKKEGSQKSVVDKIAMRTGDAVRQRELSPLVREKFKLEGVTNILNVMATPEEKIKAENRIKELDTSIDNINKKYSSSQENENISYDDFVKNAKANSSANLLEIKTIDNKLEKSGKSILKDVEKKYGIEKTEEKYVDPAEVKKNVFESVYNKIKSENKGIDDNTAILQASKKADEISSEQANTIKTKTDKGITQRKEENDLFLKQKEEKNKRIDDEIKSIRDILKQYSDGNKYNDDSEVVIGGDTYELKDAQKYLNNRLEYLDSEIEKNNEQVSELKQSIKNK